MECAWGVQVVSIRSFIQRGVKLAVKYGREDYDQEFLMIYQDICAKFAEQA